MPGQPTPPILVEAFAASAPTSSPASPIAGGRTYPFPTPSQVGVTNGAASLHDGFPAATMTPLPPTGTGTPPFGVDMNGILWYLSSHIAALNAGQWYIWESTLETDMVGYAYGAILQQAADPTAFWINVNPAGNATDPDTASPLGSTGWMSTKPLNVAVAVGGNDIVLPGASDYVYDVNAAGGAINITGFIPQRDGQKLTVRKIDSSANQVTFASLTGSAAGHQLQIVAAGLALAVQWDALTFMFNSTVNAWVRYA